MSRRRVIIIGGGFGGLAASCFLAKAGYQVTILEKNAQVGGRANLLKAKGFVFDTGPSWYTMPEVFDRFFNFFGKRTEDYYHLVKLTPIYKFFFSDLQSAIISGDPKVDREVYERFEPGSSDKAREYRRIASDQYRIAMAQFIYQQYQSPWRLLNRQFVANSLRLPLLQRMDRYIERFFKTEKLHQMMQYSLVFLGGGPKMTPAVYSLMAHVDYTLGIYYPMGGIYEVVKGMADLARELGVKIKTNSEVEEIVIRDGLAVGVKINRRLVEADIVISNADYPFTEMKLLPKKYRSYDRKYWQKKVVSPSGFILYLGVKGRIKGLEHHNVVFGHDWEEHFERIFKQVGWPQHPSYYVCAASKTDPSVAPKGDENLFILVPIAPGLKATKKFKQQYARKIIKDLELRLNQSIQEKIVWQQIFSVEDFETKYHAYKGNGLAGLVHTLGQTAIFRPQNKSRKLSNLYYTGGYTLPGIGMPICLISGQLTAERVINDDKRA